MPVEERIKWYMYLHECHKARNPKIAMAYIKRINALKAAGSQRMAGRPIPGGP